MQEWVYPYEVQTIVLNDSIEVAYVDEGESEQTLLFIHGLGSNLKAWQKNIDSLRHAYRCIALDLPGYGRSSQGDYVYGMNFFAEAVRTFIDSLALEKIVLIGHSMGGQVAMHTVLLSDDRIEKLILVAPAGFETFSEQEKTWFQAVVTPEIIKATPEEQIVKNFELNFYRMPDDARFMIEDRMIMRQTKAYGQYCRMIPQCVMGMLSEPVLDRLSGIDLPTLIIYGENDALIPNKFLHPTLSTRSVAESGREKIPGSRLILVPEAGHFVQWEQNQAVNQAIRHFLK